MPSVDEQRQNDFMNHGSMKEACDVIDKFKTLGTPILAGQIGSIIFLKQRVKSKNQSRWLACNCPMSKRRHAHLIPESI